MTSPASNVLVFPACPLCGRPVPRTETVILVPDVRRPDLRDEPACFGCSLYLVSVASSFEEFARVCGSKLLPHQQRALDRCNEVRRIIATWTRGPAGTA